MLVNNPGSPPRVRGKDCCKLTPPVCFGITPASAGKSLWAYHTSCSRWDHPRECGEKTNVPSINGLAFGSPPRVRGKVDGLFQSLTEIRITPASAGKRRRNRCMLQAPGDHPRECGEKLQCRVPTAISSGSPPRVRGKEGKEMIKNQQGRITPASAGKRQVNTPAR